MFTAPWSSWEGKTTRTSWRSWMAWMISEWLGNMRVPSLTSQVYDEVDGGGPASDQREDANPPDEVVGALPRKG